jgi:hypothetical protein
VWLKLGVWFGFGFLVLTVVSGGFFVFIFFTWKYWDLNLVSPPFESCTHPFSLLFSIGSHAFAWDHNPPTYASHTAGNIDVNDHTWPLSLDLSPVTLKLESDMISFLYHTFCKRKIIQTRYQKEDKV